jgi:hypothetical protein
VSTPPAEKEYAIISLTKPILKYPPDVWMLMKVADVSSIWISFERVASARAKTIMYIKYNAPAILAILFFKIIFFL